MAIAVPHPSRRRPVPPPRVRLRVLRRRRRWIERFWDPRCLFGLKVTILLSCFLVGAALGA